MYSDAEKKQIAETIVEQIGNKALVMFGAKNVGFGTKANGRVYVSMQVGRNSEGIKWVQVVYNPGTDLYDLEYYDTNGNIKDEDEGFYADQLTTAIAHHTKMAARLFGETFNPNKAVRDLIDNYQTSDVLSTIRIYLNSQKRKVEANIIQEAENEIRSLGK